MLCFTVFLWLWHNALKKYLTKAKINFTGILNSSSLLLLFYSVLRYCSTYNLKIYFLVLQVKYHKSYKFENLKIYLTWQLYILLRYWHTFWNNILSDFEKKIVTNRGNLPIFHEAENLFDIFTCYVRTSMAVVPPQYIKIRWKL